MLTSIHLVWVLPWSKFSFTTLTRILKFWNYLSKTKERSKYCYLFLETIRRATFPALCYIFSSENIAHCILSLNFSWNDFWIHSWALLGFFKLMDILPFPQKNLRQLIKIYTVIFFLTLRLCPKCKKSLDLFLSNCAKHEITQSGEISSKTKFYFVLILHWYYHQG